MPQLQELIVHLGEENPFWGYNRIHGELPKLRSKDTRSAAPA